MSATLQWALTTRRFGYHVYELAKDNLRLLSLAFDPATQTARVDCQETKRAFRIEKKGFFKSRIVLTNEYGVKIGELTYDKPGVPHGQIAMNNEVFFYTIHNSFPQQLVIYKTTETAPILCCDLSGNTPENGAKNLSDVYSHLLMALSWFLFLPVAKEKLLFTL